MAYLHYHFVKCYCNLVLFFFPHYYNFAQTAIFIQALWLKPDDQFSTEMLSLALVDECRGGVDPKVEFRRNDVYF